MSAKRKRGSNYTNEETAKLLELVQQHHTAVEDKRTSAFYLRQKKEAWNKICQAYNAVATSGVRTVDQLKILYDNKKQKARKALASLATHNKIKINSVLSSYNISEAGLKDAIQHGTNDDGQCSKTGGGSWSSTDTESDQKIFKLLKNQVTLLPNEFDNTATYFRDAVNTMDNQVHTGSTVTIDDADHCVKTPKIVKRQNSTTPHHPKRKKQVNYKLLYFKIKSQNAYLERRRIYQEIRLRQREHSMLVKEHQIKLQHMEEEHKMKINK